MVAALRDRPVFICGHPKSGTSLLRSLLDFHPQLVVYPEESVFFRRFLPKAKETPDGEHLALAEKYLIHIFSWNQEAPPANQAGFPDRDYSAISYERVRDVLQETVEKNGIRHPGDWLSAAVLAYGEATGQIGDETRAWVEKSPYNEYYADMIFSWWPDARCIHIVRDPRDNYVSYRRKHPDWQPEFFAENWKKSTQAGLQNREKFGGDRYMLLKYEDLVQTPETHMTKFCAFMEISPGESLREPTRAGQPWGGNSMFADRFRAVDASPVGRWKDQLQENDAAVITWMARAGMEAAGYSPVEPAGAVTG